MDSSALTNTSVMPTLSVAQSLPDNIVAPLVMSNPADGNLLILLCGQGGQDDLASGEMTCVDGNFSTAGILPSAMSVHPVSTSVSYSIAASSQNDATKGAPQLSTAVPSSSATILLSCSYCSKLFLSYRQLTQHVKSCRRSIKPYYCSDCHTGFAKASELYHHQLSHAILPAHEVSEHFSGSESSRQLLQCTSCGKAYKSSSGLRRHKKSGKCLGSRAPFIEATMLPLHLPLANSTISDDDVMCSCCSRKFETTYDLEKHVEHGECVIVDVDLPSNEDDAPLASPTFNRVQEGAESLISLQQKKTDTGSVDGCIPKKGSSKRKRRPVKNSWQLMHKGRGLPDPDKRFKCNQCDKSFGKEYHLNKHKHVHGNAMPFVCPSCNESFLSSIKYKEHCSTHGESKPFRCDLCGKGFSKMEVLRIHNRTHTGERPFPCKDCGKTFKQSSNLRDHARKHADVRPFACDICDKAFTLKGDLTKHIKIHTGEKPFQCEFCGMAFPRMSNLTRHRRKHTGEKPYSCDFCGKNFSRHEKCVEHRRTHTGERPYTCEVCGKTFKDSGNFCNHKKIHGIDKPRRRRNRPTKPSSPGTRNDGAVETDAGDTTSKEAAVSHVSITPVHPNKSTTNSMVDQVIPVAVGNNCDASVQTQGGYVMQVGNILGSLEVALGQLHGMNQDQYLALSVNDPRVLNILQMNTEQQQPHHQQLIAQPESSQCVISQDGQATAVSIDPSALQGYLTLVSALQNAQPVSAAGYATHVSSGEVQSLSTMDLSGVVCDTTQVVCSNQVTDSRDVCEEASLVAGHEGTLDQNTGAATNEVKTDHGGEAGREDN